MNEALLELVRHKTWATLALIEYLQKLDDHVLEATMLGTYGTIRATISHLVDADEDYLGMLTGQWPADPVGDRLLPLAELADRMARGGPRWETQAADSGDLRGAVADDGVRMPAAVAIAQAIHHAADHRTQILSILGAGGFDLPTLDIWAYARTQRQLLEPAR